LCIFEFLKKALAREKPSKTDAPLNLKVTLHHAPGAAGEVNLVFTVQSVQEHRLCIYHTPLESFSRSILDIKDAGGESVGYLGPMIKRGPPSKRDYVTVRPNEPLAATFNLAHHYGVAGGSTYTVQFKGNPFTNGLPDSNILALTVP
jgi:hypothetical protein